MEHIKPHFIFLEESDYDRYRNDIPSFNRLSGMFVGPSILRWKLRHNPPPACDAVFVQSFEIMPALQDLNPLLPVILAHDSTNILSYRLIRDVDPTPTAKFMCGIKSILVTPNYRSVINRARAFLPRTHWAARSLIRDFGVSPDRIIVAPGGLDTDLWKPDWSRVHVNPPTLLWVGNDFVRKGGEFLLDLFVKHIYPRARLRIISNQKDLKHREWPDGVEFITGLEHGNPFALVEAYRSADVFVFPTRKEHMGMVLTEACAVGLPIIATNVGGVREVVRDGGNGFVIPYDAGAEAWADAILELVGNPTLRERFAVASRELAENEFSIHVLQQRVEQAFAKLA